MALDSTTPPRKYVEEIQPRWSTVTGRTFSVSFIAFPVCSLLLRLSCYRRWTELRVQHLVVSEAERLDLPEDYRAYLRVQVGSLA